MCKKFYYLVIIIFILSCGCASKMNVLNKDNIKLPENIYTSSHIPTGLTIQAFMAAMSEQSETSYLFPEKYLDIGNVNKINELAHRTVMISGKIKIINPDKKYYSIKTVAKIKYKKSKYPYKCERILYRGSSEQKVFVFDEYIESSNPLVNYSIIVKSGNFEVFNIQTNYKIE